MSTGAHPQHPQHPLRDAETLRSAVAVFGSDYDSLATVLRTFTTWEELAALPTAALAHVIGPAIASLSIPPLPPLLAPLPAKVDAYTMFDEPYPAGLRDLTRPPLLIYVTGTLPATASLAIAGSDHPTPAGIEIATAAALTASMNQVPIVASLADGCGLAAMRTAVEVGAKVVAVMPHGFAVTSMHQRLMEAVLAGGGAVVTACAPGELLSASATAAAEAVAVGISCAVLLAEVGTSGTHARVAAQEAVHCQRYLIVPAPEAPMTSGRYLPASAFGAALFTSAREWSADPFGSNARIEDRIEQGLPPADQVVADHAQLSEAIKIACPPPL